MNHPTPATRLLIGCCWAQATLVLGMSLLFQALTSGQSLLIGLAVIAAGFFLAMCLVIDVLVPDAGRVFTQMLKLAAVMLFYTCGGLTVYGMLTGPPGGL